MDIIYKSEKLNMESSVVALGNFDGVHIGHKKLIDEIVFHSKKEAIPSVVWSFRKHPESILGGRDIKSITTLDEKIELFSEYGVDTLILENFEEIKNLSPDEFIDNILLGRLGAKLVVVGFNFRFGKSAAGTSEYLKQELEKRGCTVKIIPPVIYGETLVSSTVIREFIKLGNMEETAMLLGRPFFISFPVVHGRQLGRQIGVPTINQLFPEDHVVPQRGVYAATCYIGSMPYLGVCNVGVRPTVSSNETLTCETHIIDFSGNLYGENIKVEFYKKLRPEMKFSSTNELVRQIKNDIADTKSYFNLHF